MTQNELIILSLPILAAVITSWMAVWYFKRLWRGAKPDWRDRLMDWQIIIIAFLCSGTLAVIYQWVLVDYIAAYVGYEIDALKFAIVSVLISAFTSPWLFGVLLWFVLTPIDFKIWKKPSWRGLYEFLNVPHKKNVDYNDGKSDLTRFIDATDTEQHEPDFKPTEETKDEIQRDTRKGK